MWEVLPAIALRYEPWRRKTSIIAYAKKTNAQVSLRIRSVSSEPLSFTQAVCGWSENFNPKKAVAQLKG